MIEEELLISDNRKSLPEDIVERLSNVAPGVDIIGVERVFNSYFEQKVAGIQIGSMMTGNALIYILGGLSLLQLHPTLSGIIGTNKDTFTIKTIATLGTLFIQSWRGSNPGPSAIKYANHRIQKDLEQLLKAEGVIKAIK